MKTGTAGKVRLIAVAFMLGFLASCAQTGGFEAHGVDLDRAAQHARTAADHDRLARQYRSSAEKLQAKVEEQRQLLSQYEEKSYIYGRRAQDLQSHTSALLHKYERAMEETIQQASYHGRMAEKLAQDAPAQQRDERQEKARSPDSMNWNDSGSGKL